MSCVAGEKRLIVKNSDGSHSSGEGFYWKYESWLKKQDAQLYSAMGAAGELFAIRKAEYEHLSSDVILDDFVISMSVLKKEKVIAYEPYAYASEKSSKNIMEEMKRKVRISAGGIQSISKVLPLLNIFKHPLVSFQLVYHRLLRWTLAPLSILLLLPLNIYLCVQNVNSLVYLLMLAQIIFYSLAFVGLRYKDEQQSKLFYVPFYFLFKNYCMLKGAVRFMKGKQSVIWVKAERMAI